MLCCFVSFIKKWEKVGNKKGKFASTIPMCTYIWWIENYMENMFWILEKYIYSHIQDDVSMYLTFSALNFAVAPSAPRFRVSLRRVLWPWPKRNRKTVEHFSVVIPYYFWNCGKFLHKIHFNFITNNVQISTTIQGFFTVRNPFVKQKLCVDCMNLDGYGSLPVPI